MRNILGNCGVLEDLVCLTDMFLTRFGINFCVYDRIVRVVH